MLPVVAHSQSNRLSTTLASMASGKKPLKTFWERMEKFIKINQLDGVAELQYKYASLDESSQNEVKEDVRCCLAVPTITLMKVPLHVTCTYDKKVQLGRGVDVTYTVHNSFSQCNRVYISVLIEGPKQNCLLAGELVS